MSGYNLGTAQGRIVIDPSGAVAGSRVAQGAMGALKTGFGGVSKSAAAMGLGVAGAGLSVGGAFVYAVNSAASFEQRMSAVKAVSGATSGEMQSLSDLALQLGADTSFSASQAASAIEELVKAGVSVPDVMNGAAAATVALAAAGELDLPQAATIASNAMNQFGLSAKEMPKVADLIAGAANASAIDVSDFGMSLGQVGAVAKLAGLGFKDTAIAIAEMGNAGIKGSDAGTSLKSMLSYLQPTTDKASAAMESLGIITKDGANRFYDASGKLKSLKDIQDILGQSLQGLTAQQKQATLQTIFGSDAIRAAAILSDNGAKGYDKMATAMGKMTAADVAATRMDNLKGAIEQFTGSIETVAIKAGQLFLPMLRNMVAGLTDVVNFIGANLGNAVETVRVFFAALTGGNTSTKLPWAAAIVNAANTVQPVFDAIRNTISNVFNFIANSVVPTAKIFASVFGPVLAAAVGAVIVAIGKASDVLQPLGTMLLAVANYVKQNETAFRAIAVAILAGLAAWKAYQAVVGIINLVRAAVLNFRVAMTLLNIAMRANVIGIIITAITALVAAFIYLWNNNEGFRNFFLNMWSAIQSAVQAVVGWFQGTLVPAFQAVWNGIISGFSAVGSFFATIWSGIQTGLAAVGAFFSTVWNAILSVVQTVFSAIMTVITTYINIWRTIITTVLNAILFVWQGVWNLFGPLVKAAWDLIIAIVQFAVKLLLFIIMAPIRGLLTLFQLVWSGIQAATSAFWNWISPYVSAAVNAIRSVISSVFNAIRSVVTTVWNAIQAASSAVWNAIKSVVSTVVNAIRSVVSSVFNGIRSTAVTVWNAVKAAVTGPINSAKATVSTVVNAIKSAVSTAFNAAKTAAITAFNALKSGVSDAINAVKTTVSGIVDSIKGIFSGAGNWLLDAGKKIVGGLIQGITNMIGKVKEKLNFLTNLIPDWKGPISKDKVLLEQNGEVIMGGLIRGIENMVGPLAKTLGSITSSVPDMAAAGTVGSMSLAPASASAAGNYGDTYITIQIDPKDLPGLANLSSFVENLRQQARQRSGVRN